MSAYSRVEDGGPPAVRRFGRRLAGWRVGWWLWLVGLGMVSGPRCEGAAGDIVVMLTVTAKGKATIATAMNDQCEATFTARLLYRLNPETGRYGRPAEEQYTMAASGNGNIMDIESWTYSELQPGLGSASLTYLPKDGKAIVGWSYVDDHIASQPEGGQAVERMARSNIKMAEDVLIMKEDCGLVTFTPNAPDFSASGSSHAEYSDMFGSAEITASYSVRRQSEELEAVIIPPKDYAGWVPSAGPDANTPGTNPVVVMAELRVRGTKATPPFRKATFRFELVNGSREPGLCLNDPPKSEAKSDFDLQFGASKGIQPTHEKQRYETEDPTTSSSAVILCHDYGAHARLKVTAITDMGEEIAAVREDQPAQQWLDLPEDQNENGIADSWERGQGTWGIAEKPEWDESDDPKDQDGKGDGISLYEKYRGFRFDRTHERLEAKKKHVFVYDPDGVLHLNLGSVMSFERASNLRVRFVEDRTWTGSGTAGSKRRIVNFNTSGYGHATDQHAIHVRMVYNKSPVAPQDYQDMWTAKYGHPDNFNPSEFYGVAYSDVTGVANMESPGGVLVIELYPWGTERISRNFVRYHTFGLPQFANNSGIVGAERQKMLEEGYALAEEHIRTHGQDWEEQNLTYLMAGLSHEMGHGVSVDDLVPPNTDGPRFCFMRYINRDFPRNTEDRMELTARWRSAVDGPREFCHDPTGTIPGKGCYEQIHVTDRKPPGPALQRTPDASSAQPEVAASRWLAASLPSTNSPLSMSAFLEWEFPLAGDPLRFSVRLSWPSMMNSWASDLHTRGTNASKPTFPTIAATWPEGLRLELARMEADGRRTTIVPAGSWTDALRSLEGDPAVWEGRLGTHSREFLTDPAKVPLTAGIYALTVAWDGRGRVDPSLLPASGQLTGGEIQFEVRAVAEARDRVTQLRRLSFRAWDRDDFETARQRGLEAMALAPADSDREALDTALLVVTASRRAGDARGSYGMLRDILAAPNYAAHRTARRLASSMAGALVPSVSLAPGSAPGARPVIQVYGHVGQTCEVQTSADLSGWTPVDRRTLTQSPYDVAEPGVVSGEKARFYRVVWVE